MPQLPMSVAMYGADRRGGDTSKAEQGEGGGKERGCNVSTRPAPTWTPG